MTVRLDKSARKQPKPVEENKPAEPEQKFDLSKFKAERQNQKFSDVNGKPARRGPGRPRRNETFGVVRISEASRGILNSYKEATKQGSQSDAIVTAIKTIYENNLLSPKEKKAFEALLAVKDIEL